MIYIYMCRAASQRWADPPPPTKCIFDVGPEIAILGPLMRDNLIRFPTDPSYTIETLGM